MQDSIPNLFAFNKWANNKMLDACRKLTQEQYTAEPIPGWSSVRNTVWHIAVVTEAWLSRLANDPNINFPTEADLPTVEDAAKLLEKAYGRFDDMFPKYTPAQLETPVTLRLRTRVALLPPWAVFRHLVNHTTYHRGQVSSKLKRFGIQHPETDFVYWLFEQIPQPESPA